MAIYTIVDNRDIDNKEQNKLSSVVSLSAFEREMSGLISGDYLDDTIKNRMAWMDLSSLTKISSDLSVLLKDEHLSSMVTLSADLDEKLRTIHLNQMTQVDSDVYSKIGNYLTEHGYVPGGGGGSGTITYKYWRGITIPPHPGGGEPVVVKTDISEKCRMEIYPDSFEYTGSDITTDVSVILESTGGLLTKDSDYVLTYVDNRNQGTAKVVASGTGNYTGTLFKTFSITRTLTDIATATITINRDSFVYNGSSQVPTITSVTIGGKTLTVNTDYTVESPTVETTNVGEKYIQIRGVESSGYTGTCSKTYFITKADIRNFEAQAYLEQDEYEFAGTPVVPDVYGLEGLTKNTDYTVTYQNNESVTDNAKAIVTGIGNYEYSFELGFTIVAAPIADYKLLANATVTVGTYTQTYDGSEKNPQITVVDKNGTTLMENVHYTKTVSSNVNAGTGRIVINAVESSGYEGSKETTFQITKANVSYTASGNSCRWDSSASISVSVTYPSAGNYTVYYKSGTGSWSTTNPSFGGSEASVGTHTVYFKIVPTDTDNINSVGTDGSLSKSVTVTSDTLTVSASGATGTWLDTKSISVSSNPTATITYSTDNSTFGSANPSYGKGNKSDKGTHTVYYKVQKNGYTTVTGSQTVELSAVAISSATITLSQTSYDLKGFDAQRSYNDCKPTVTVKTGSTTHTLNSDYTLTYPTGSLAAGGSTTVSVTISGTGAFTGSTTKSYSISYNYYPTYYLTGATNPSSIGSVTVSDSGQKMTSTGSYDFTCTATVPDTHTFNGWTVSGKSTCSSTSSNPTTVNSTGTSSGSATATANYLANQTVTRMKSVSGTGINSEQEDEKIYIDQTTGEYIQAKTMHYSLGVKDFSLETKSVVFSDQTTGLKSDSYYSSDLGVTFTYTEGHEVKSAILNSKGEPSGGLWWYSDLDGNKYYHGKIYYITAAGNNVKYRNTNSEIFTVVSLNKHASS